MSENSYSLLDKLLHSVALGSSMIGDVCFDLESATHRNLPSVETGRHVFVSGLARSGTTVFMNVLYETGMFRSLTYRDMPFILMPNTWRKLSGGSRKHETEKERAHGDGVMVNFDSPEALEDVFWRIFHGQDYIRSRELVPHHVNKEGLRRFRQYVGLILHQPETPQGNKANYLSKNNNNILRLNSIRTAFPNALIAIPFRHPLQQALSLLNQHLHFQKVHTDDPFSLKYMRWLVHHEFGGDHRPFNFGASSDAERKQHDPTSIDYWLSRWIDAYAYLASTAPEGAHFVCYESLCLNPLDTMRGVLDPIAPGVEMKNLQERFTAAPEKQPPKPPDAQLLREATDLYRQLSERGQASSIQG